MAKKDTPPANAGTEAPAGVVSETTAPPVGVDPFAHVGDAHWGIGGRYIVGEDGKRVPAPLTPDTEANHG